jgi:membrane protease YdiL (CAAX protease family)
MMKIYNSISPVSQATNSQPVFQEQRLSLGKTLVLHLLPGALITTFFFLTAPSLIGLGFPPILSLYLGILLILIPFELGFLCYQRNKRNEHDSLEGIVLFRERLPIWQMVALIVTLFVWSGFVFSLLPKLDTFILQTFFAWFPNWSFPANLLGDSNQYSKAALSVTMVAGFLLNGIAGPVVEELYFRGYLLPRIPASKGWAPLINVLLFSLYHFFSPWQNLTRILAFLPLSYAVAWKRNMYLSMGAHCLLNTAGMVIAFAL